MTRSQALVSCILVLIGLSASGVQGQFPYCRCIDKSQGSSPYALVVSSIKSSSSSLTATFTVVNTTAPANPSACYKKILANGAPKFEIDSSTICLAAGNRPVIKINGVISTPSGIVAPPNFNGKASIKTKFIPNYKGAATTITITGYGACANWNTLFNSKSTGVFSFAVFSTEAGGLCCPSGTVYAAPPPPKPVSPGDSPYAPGQLAPPGPAPGPPFPFCRCNQSVTASPYDFSGDFAVKAEDKVTWYTGTVGSKSCDPASPCCNMGLDKIELHIRDACKGSVAKYAYVTTAGTPPVTQARTISYASYGAGRTTLKLARLPWTAATAGDATFAFALLKNSACPTLSSLLAGKGQIAFFNKGNACCPTYSGF